MTGLLLHSGSVLDVQSYEVRTADVVLADDRIVDIGIGLDDFFEDPSLPDPILDGADAARAVVRRMVRAGADWIKVTATGSMAIGKGVHDIELTADEMGALVDEARRRGGRKVMVHAHGARAVELAARAGAASVEHGTYLDEDAVAAMAEAGTWYVPTLSVTQSDWVTPGRCGQ
jgi:imidazolonepropionase-like amidohydrolase